MKRQLETKYPLAIPRQLILLHFGLSEVAALSPSEKKQCLETFKIDKSTLSRWLSGKAKNTGEYHFKEAIRFLLNLSIPQYEAELERLKNDPLLQSDEIAIAQALHAKFSTIPKRSVGKPKILIQEVEANDQHLSLRISFSGGPSFEVSFASPFDSDTENDLEWYLDRHLTQPFSPPSEVNRTRNSLQLIGTKLYEHLFGNEEIAATLSQFIAQHTGSMIKLAFQGESGAFHAIPWESLWRPKDPHPLVFENFHVVRVVSADFETEKIIPITTLRVLIVSARPSGHADISYQCIQREVVETVDQQQPVAGTPTIIVHVMRPGKWIDLIRQLDPLLTIEKYDIIHLDLHGGLYDYETLAKGKKSSILNFNAFQNVPGTPYNLEPFKGRESFLLFESDKDGYYDIVSAAVVRQVLGKYRPTFCIVNACQSAKQPIDNQPKSLIRQIAEAGVPFVLGMRFTVRVDSAKILTKTLYQYLLCGYQIPEATICAVRAMLLDKGRENDFGTVQDIDDWVVPVLFQSMDAKWTGYNLEPQTAKSRTKPTWMSDSYVHEESAVFDLERQLSKSKLLIFSGEKEIGQSTLLRYLVHWWQTTQFASHVWLIAVDKAATIDAVWGEIESQMNIRKSGITKSKMKENLQGTNPIVIFDDLCKSKDFDIAQTAPLFQIVRDLMAVMPNLRVVFTVKSPPSFAKNLKSYFSNPEIPIGELTYLGLVGRNRFRFARGCWQGDNDHWNECIQDLAFRNAVSNTGHPQALRKIVENYTKKLVPPQI